MKANNIACKQMADDELNYYYYMFKFLRWSLIIVITLNICVILCMKRPWHLFKKIYLYSKRNGQNGFMRERKRLRLLWLTSRYDTHILNLASFTRAWYKASSQSGHHLRPSGVTPSRRNLSTLLTYWPTDCRGRKNFVIK